MMALQSVQNVLILLVCFASLALAYKKDHGFGFLFKHDPNMKQRQEAEKLTNDRIREAVTGTEGGYLFPVPYQISDIQTKYSGATLDFTGIRMYGLDRVRPLQINTDFTNLIVSLTLSMDQLNMLGDFRMTPWVANAEGTFNYTIVDAWLVVEAELMLLNEGTRDEGYYVRDISKSQLIYDELQLNIDNIGILSTILQPVKNSISRYIFNQLKPTLCNRAELVFRNLFNKVLTNVSRECPDAINTVDKALLRTRKSMKTSLLDPLFISDHYPKSTNLVKLELTQGKLVGLSTIKRTGPILIGFERDSIHMMLNLGVQNLKGQYSYMWMLWKNLLTHRGILQFNVHDIAIKVKLEKHLGSNNNVTRVEKIELKVGSVNLLSDGVGAVKYVMERFLNVVPDSFRQRIIDAAEYRLEKVIEDEIAQIDLEQLVEDESNEIPVDS